MRDDIVLGETLYRTGDLVYRNERGDYVYVDRSDRVVKRSGVRISLVELSASMNKLDGVVAAACVTFDREGELGIAAFVVTESERSPIDLRRAASTLIPENMLPDRIELVAAMPLNRSNMWTKLNCARTRACDHFDENRRLLQRLRDRAKSLDSFSTLIVLSAPHHRCGRRPPRQGPRIRSLTLQVPFGNFSIVRRFRSMTGRVEGAST